MAAILIIEDDLRLATFIQMSLQARGHCTHLALTGHAGLSFLESEAIDLILLDLDLPDIPGVSLCARLRPHYRLPILIFSAEGQVAKKVEALEAGANDYIVKPIDVRELLARVDAQLQAVSRLVQAGSRTCGKLTYCPEKDQFHSQTMPLSLNVTSHQLLRSLFQKAGEVLSKAELYAQVWNGPYVAERDSHLLEVNISRLRKQLKKCESACQIQTAYGKGYYLHCEAPLST